MSVLLMLSVVLLLAVLGGAIGFALTGDPVGAVAVTIGAAALGTMLALGSYFSGDQLVLRASQARPVTAEDAPQLTTWSKSCRSPRTSPCRRST